MECKEIKEQITGKWIQANDEHLVYVGRMDHEDPEGVLMVYPASFVTCRFTGSKVECVVTNHRSYFDSYMGWILDGVEGKAKLNDEGITVVSIAQDLSEGEHELLFFKRMDSCHTVTFHGLVLSEEGKMLDKPVLPNRRIEVYGDSVSAGEVSEAVHCIGQPDPEHNGEYSNSYYSYSWLTARRLHAQLHDIAQGGIALLENTGYFNMPHTRGMEWVYDKIQYNTAIGEPKKWDFSRYTPEVVVLAFGQNDNHPIDYMKEDFDSEDAKIWRAKYKGFVQHLLELYPKAHIICKTTILCHDASWDRAIENCVKELQSSRVHYFRYSNNSVGTPGHIRKPEAEKMAEELSTYIEELNETFRFWK